MKTTILLIFAFFIASSCSEKTVPNTELQSLIISFSPARFQRTQMNIDFDSKSLTFSTVEFEKIYAVNSEYNIPSCRVLLNHTELNDLISILDSFKNSDFTDSYNDELMDGMAIRISIFFKEEIKEILLINTASEKQIELFKKLFQTLKENTNDEKVLAYIKRMNY